jgi:tetratricopeptide (TPR) repeat protein
MSKKRRSSKRRTSSKARRQAQREAPPPMFDRRAMEKSLADLTRLLSEHEFESEEEMQAFLDEVLRSGGPPEAAPRTPLEEAQDLMYEAWEARGRRRVALARQALEVSPDCADAYVLLAEETARSLEEARDLYAQGVEAGERALGPEAFEEDVGHFWGLLETRPYMRARNGLAQCLWMLGEQEAAMEHYRDMLRLNPSDNQGLRYRLASCLLQLDHDEELEALLNQYEDEATADWLYTWTLLAFRRQGDSREARKRLGEARHWNPHVPAYLLGRKRLPRRLPDTISIGEESEAISYAAEFGESWHRTEGALEWLATMEATR